MQKFDFTQLSISFCENTIRILKQSNYVSHVCTVQDVNIGQELINEGLAEPEEALSSAASSTLSLSTRSHELPTVSTPASSSPLARKTLSPETAATSSRKSDLTAETTMETLDSSILDGDISSRIEEINLVTPQVSTLLSVNALHALYLDARGSRNWDSQGEAITLGLEIFNLNLG